jgi:2-oxoglutarate dehydrogenase E2 component (dihydrolipoamide succinyltransferase)
MIIEVKVPVLSESVSEATLLSWHKKQGDYVERDENLIDIETDKVVLELPAPESGTLASISKEGGASVVGDEVIATIDTKTNPPAGFKPSHAPEPAKKPEAIPEKRVETPVAEKPDATSEKEELNAMPAARKLAAEKNVDVAQISGSGRGGRVTKEDVVSHTAKVGPSAPNLSAIEATASPPSNVVSAGEAAVSRDSQVTRLNAGVRPAARPEVIPSAREEKRVAMSRLRARIAERLVQSQATTATLTTFNEVNMQPVIALRNRYKEQFEKEHGVKLGFMSFFVKASIHALKKYPIVNASVDGNDIVYHNYYDIGIAVGTPRGLVVPILRGADQMTIAEIEKAIADFGIRAKDGKLSLEELTGGTFSISNGGVFGSMLSTPIINPPQSAILGIHATKERAVVENGQIVIRPMNYLALSYDHRIIDGREAVLSLVAIKEALEDPARMLLDL